MTHDDVVGQRQLTAAGMLLAGGEFVFGWGTYRLLGPHALVWTALTSAAATLFIAGISIRPVPFTRPVRAALLLIALLPVFYLVWWNHAVLAASGRLWAPFMGLKIVVFGLALLTPAGPWLNLALIGGFAIETTLLWFKLEISEQPGAVATEEPWFTFIYFGVCAGLLIVRWTTQRLREQVHRSEAQTAAMTEMAQVFLRMRDLQNTPLQNILTTAELLEKQHPELAPQTERIRRGVLELQSLSEGLKKYELVVPPKATPDGDQE